MLTWLNDPSFGVRGAFNSPNAFQEGLSWALARGYLEKMGKEGAIAYGYAYAPTFMFMALIAKKWK